MDDGIAQKWGNIQQAGEAEDGGLYLVGIDQGVLVVVADEDVVNVYFPVVAEAYTTNGDVDIVLLVDVLGYLIGNKGLNSGDGKKNDQDDKKQQQGEQRFTNYFPEFFDRVLCFNFANNINDF